MTHDVFNSDTSRAKSSRRSKASVRIVASEWNGQAVPTNRSNATYTKTGAFKVEFSMGAMVVKKTPKKK